MGQRIKKRTVVIGGKRWLVHTGCRLKDSYGHVDYDNRIIRLAKHKDPYEYADTIVHECLHALLPQLSEECVTHVATEIVAFIQAIDRLDNAA